MPPSEWGRSVPTWPVQLAAPLAVLWMVAAPLPAPEGTVLLTVRGNLLHGDDVVPLDRDALERLGPVELRTWTPWTDGEPVFRGVLVRDLLAELGAEGEVVVARALNDYHVTIPIAELERYDILLAFERDGLPLTRRDMGPLWIVYPWSDHPELDDRVSRQRSVWQLMELEVR
jgi:hypothetical protein